MNFLGEVQSKDYNVDHFEKNTINAPSWVGRNHSKKNYPRRITRGPPEKVSKTENQKPGCSIRGKKCEMVHSSRDNFEARWQF